MKSRPLLAHPEQSLADHLSGVARLAKGFASHFGAERQAELAGLLHDLGKADDEFQKRMAKTIGASQEDGQKRPHAHHGAALALAHQLWPVAFAINGHHAGLHDRSDLQMVFGDLVWVKGADDPLTGKKCQHSVRNEEGAWLENSAPDHKPLILEHHSQASDPEIKGTDKLLIPNDGWAKMAAPEGSDSGRTFLEWLQNPRRFRLVKNPQGGIYQANFLTPDEWRTIQPYVVALGFPSNDKTRQFLREYACLVFNDDDATRGLHRLTATDFYSDGPNGAGINVVDPILTNLDYCP